MNSYKLVLISFLFGLIAGVVIDYRSPLYAQSLQQAVSFRQYNNHWQNHQNEKMVICYQKMSTMDAVKICMIRLGVFI